MSARLGWWLTRDPVERGDVHHFRGTPIPGRAGLHAATSPLAALPYAKHDRLCRVSLHGDVVQADDQMAATVRRIEHVIEAGPLLREIARRSIERLLGAPLRDRAAHLSGASAGRERVIECDERIADARWALEGARVRTAADRAQAEGRLDGALRAAAEARRDADAHEAAAALLEASDISAVARAFEHLVRASAVLERGDADRALIEARERIDAEVLAAIEPLAPAEPLPPYVPPEPGPAPVAFVPHTARASAPPRWPHTERLRAERLEPEDFDDLELARAAPSEEHGLALAWSATPLAPTPPRIEPDAARVSPFRLVTIAPEGEASSRSSTAEVIDRLRGVLRRDPAFVSLHRVPVELGLVLLVRRAREHGARELLAALRDDPVLSRDDLSFVVAWDGARAEGRGHPRWFVSGRAGEPAATERAVLAARCSPAIDVEGVDLFAIEMILAGVRRYEWVAPRGLEPVLVMLAAAEAAASILTRARAAGIERALVVAYGEGRVTYFVHEGPELEALTPSDIPMEPALDPRCAPLSARPPLGDALVTGSAWLGAALATGPAHLAVHALTIDPLHDAYVVVTDTSQVERLGVHLARALRDELRTSVFVVPEDPGPALHEGAIAVAASEPWLEPAIDDFRFVDAVFESMERPSLDLARAGATTAVLSQLAPLLDRLGVVSSAGVLSGEPALAVWIVDAFAEARVRDELERAAPGTPMVFVTGASRLTPGLEAHVIAPNASAEDVVRDSDLVRLASSLYRALSTDARYRRSP